MTEPKNLDLKELAKIINIDKSAAQKVLMAFFSILKTLPDESTISLLKLFKIIKINSKEFLLDVDLSIIEDDEELIEFLAEYDHIIID